MREKRRPDADADSLFGRLLRASRHPLRALAMGTAVFCLVADIALTLGLVSGVLGAMAGVFAGEVLGRTRLKHTWVLGGLALVTSAALALAATIVRVEWLVSLFGTSMALSLVGALRYGSLAFFLTAAMRATAQRKPSWLAMELAFVVLSVASALAAHRHGVIARPLWLSDWAWRRGMDPTDALFAFGLGAALLSLSLLLFERRGRLSVAALPLLPLVAMLGVSCLEVTGAGPNLPDGEAGSTDAQGEPPNETEHDENERGPSDDGSDGGVPRRDGSTRDAGAGPRDAGLDGAAGGGPDGGDAGEGGGRDGGGGGGLDGSTQDGGGGGLDGSARDGGGGGGGADATMTDAGGGAWEGWDAGLDDDELPPPDRGEGGEGGSGNAQAPEDLFETPPRTGDAAAAPVAVVLFENDYSPPSGAYYFRQDAWSEWNGSRLVPARLPEADRDVADRYPVGRMNVQPPPTEGRSVVLARVAQITDDAAPMALEAPVWLADARNPNRQRFRRAYRFSSRAQSVPFPELMGRAAGDPDWSDDLRALYLAPHPDPRFSALAEEIVSGLPLARREDAFSRAVAIKLWLDERLTYSTRERHADAEDPTVDFLFGNRIGYCVHFAHAAVFLYRAAGVPARIGVGYCTPEANRRGGSALLIRSGEAHAWPELYLEDVGWIPLDIAAAESLDPPGAPADDDLQRLLSEMAREQPPEPEDEVRDEAREPPLSAALVGKSLLALFLLALLAVLIVCYLVKLWRRLAPRLAGASAQPRVAFRLDLDRLAEVGLTRDFGETREQFARRVAATVPTFSSATEMMLAVRFGAPGSTVGRPEHDPARWREVNDAIRKEVRESTPLWRRLLGILHPSTFLDAR